MCLSICLFTGIGIILHHIDCHDDEDGEAEGAEERAKRKGQADEEKDRVDSVLHGLGEVLEQVKEVTSHRCSTLLYSTLLFLT